MIRLDGSSVSSINWAIDDSEEDRVVRKARERKLRRRKGTNAVRVSERTLNSKRRSEVRRGGRKEEGNDGG